MNGLLRISTRKIAAIALAVIALAILPAIGMEGAGAQAGEYRLTVLHTSENHGHWEPFTQTISMGGIARRATLVKQIRAEGGNILLLDAGDVSQGTLYFIQHRMAEGAEFYNALGYDAVAIGNHEFDLGPKTFAENYVANAHFAIVSTNLDFSSEPLLSGKIPPFVVKTVGGEKIGLLGFTTEDVVFDSAMGPTIRIKPRVDSAKAAVAELRQQGVNKIIALSHLGYPEDLKLAASVDGIGVIVSGHTFTLLGDAAKLDKALGPPDGPYPTVVKSPSGNPVLIVHAFDWGKLLGRLNVTFDAQGVPVKWDGDPILVDSTVADDPEVEALRQKLADPLLTLRQTVIGKSEANLDGSPRVLRSRESSLGDLVADAMLDATRGDRTQIALMNGGGIRTSIAAGDVTVGNVLEVLPFGNRLVQMDLKGTELLAALENGVSQVSDSAGRFPQVAGLRFAFDPGKPAGKRVNGVEIGTYATGFQPLDPTASYRIVTNDFMAGGGDGYDVLKNGANVRGGDIPLDSVVLDYIKARGTIAPKVEGRIVQGALPQTGPPAAQPTAAGVAAAPRAAVSPTNAPAAAAAPQPADGGAAQSANLIWPAAVLALAAATLAWAWDRRRKR